MDGKVGLVIINKDPSPLCLNYIPSLFRDNSIIETSEGLGRARNMGARKLNGNCDTLVFLDGDIIPFIPLWDCIGKVEDKTLLMSFQRDVYNNIKASTRVMMIRQKDFWELGGFDEHYTITGEDRDFMIRAQKKGFKMLQIPLDSFYHKPHEFRSNGSIEKQFRVIKENARLFLSYGNDKNSCLYFRWMLKNRKLRRFFATILMICIGAIGKVGE